MMMRAWYKAIVICLDIQERVVYVIFTANFCNFTTHGFPPSIIPDSIENINNMFTNVRINTRGLTNDFHIT